LIKFNVIRNNSVTTKNDSANVLTMYPNHSDKKDTIRQ
jgi:hypothetical protein